MINIKVYYRYTDDGPEFTEDYMNMTEEQTKKIIDHWNANIETGDLATCTMMTVWG